ncbi:MAG TPA: CHAT domain-containing protein [Thermoanaerobaculia bacterium]|nr:CHAT domain-containing protein [Thermoanaerobaculia bacterium]
MLERATGSFPGVPSLRSDLAAAYLMQAEERQRPEDLIRALSEALEADRLDPTLQEAAFNRALITEKLFLRQQAIEAWNAYRKLDPDSEWGQEAKRHLQRLQQPTLTEIWPAERDRLTRGAEAGNVPVVLEIVRRFPQASREHVEEELFGAWAEAQGAGDLERASRLLKAVEVIGDALREVTGDAMARDSVAVIHRSLRTQDTSQKERLIEGFRAFRQGKKLYDALELAEAAGPLDEARLRLKAAGSPFEAWAVFYRGFCTYRSGDLSRALEEFQAIERRASYPVLGAHQDWMIGLIDNQQGRFGESIERYQAALTGFEAARQAQSTASVHFLISEGLLLLGETRASTLHLHQALGLRDSIFRRRWRMTILKQSARTARRTNFPRAALAFENESVFEARQEAKPAIVGEALISRASTLQEIGDDEAALRDLDEAWRAIQEVSDPGMYRLSEAQFFLARGKVLRDSDPSEAVAELSTALARRAATGNAVLTTPIYLERGKAYRIAGQEDLAEADFRAGIEAFEQRRGGVDREELRISYFDQSREIFDEMIRLQVDVRRDPWRALEYGERARARELLDTVSGREAPVPGPVLEPGAVLGRLPAGLALVHYAVLEDATLAWVLTRTRAELVRIPIRAVDLNALTLSLTQEIHSGSRFDPRGAASKLYDLLILPLRTAIPANGTLVFVPDKRLHEVPFAGLHDAIAGRYLIEDHAVAVSPSSTLLLRALERDSVFAKLRGERLLAIGNPAVDLGRFPDLAPLPGSEVEARRIAELYPHAKVRLGREATKRAFLETLRESEIVHLGAHALSNQEFPPLSRIFLAPDPSAGDDGTLLAHEIAGSDLSSTRLLVLAACSTARARISPGEGALSLARPFLGAGVPAVVATLWDIEDGSSPELFETFYRRLREGSSPIRALQEAQISSIHHSDPILRQPRTWAAFELIQGSGR